MAATDFSKVGDQVQVTVGGDVVGTYDRNGSSYNFLSNGNLQVLFPNPNAQGQAIGYTVALADLRVAGAGSAPADEAAALVALGTVWSSVSYTEYAAFLTENGLSNPTVVVLENGLSGAIVWARVGVGEFTGTLNGAFPANKTFCLTSKVADDDGLLFPGRISDNVVSILFSEGSGYQIPVLIRIYP